MRVVLPIFPRFQQLDMTGPFEVFSRCPELEIGLVWKTMEPVIDVHGLRILPTQTFADCPQADILCMPGGAGQIDLMEDREVLDFLRRQAEHAAYVTSVCTGSLVLAAAGLLTGYRATCHWLSLNQLEYFGVVAVAERVVVDRNRMTGAGVTSGIDFALALVARIFGADRAKAIALSMEYDPKPPFPGGSVTNTEPKIIEAVRAETAKFQAEREIVARRSAEALRGR
jgi:cyclohexyl-isocyanide hydratase